MAFETDLPAIEVKGSQDNAPFCNVLSGSHCVDPPAGAAFYPFYSIAQGQNGCTWHEGGDHIPGTTNDFGGNSSSEFGPLLDVLFPNKNGRPVLNFEDFNSGDLSNPC
jgi:hypothetical protein